jgi:hypothetical protein
VLLVLGKMNCHYVLIKKSHLQSSVVKNDCVRISTVSEWKKITNKIEQCCILCISIPRTTAKVYEKSEYNKIDETYQLLIKENMKKAVY